MYHDDHSFIVYVVAFPLFCFSLNCSLSACSLLATFTLVRTIMSSEHASLNFLSLLLSFQSSPSCHYHHSWIRMSECVYTLKTFRGSSSLLPSYSSPCIRQMYKTASMSPFLDPFFSLSSDFISQPLSLSPSFYPPTFSLLSLASLPSSCLQSLIFLTTSSPFPIFSLLLLHSLQTYLLYLLFLYNWQPFRFFLSFNFLTLTLNTTKDNFHKSWLKLS